MVHTKLATAPIWDFFLWLLSIFTENISVMAKKKIKGRINDTLQPELV
jgi:hypothetical protein